jgi:hypothetical protein
MIIIIIIKCNNDFRLFRATQLEEGKYHVGDAAIVRARLRRPE